jgi:hypothetical protein
MEKPGSGTFLTAMNPVGIDFETIPQYGSNTRKLSHPFVVLL